MYVYWCHVGELVKVGHADDPIERMTRYLRDHELIGEDLRVYELDVGTDAEWVAARLRRMLEANALRRIEAPMGVGADEFHSLAGRTFDDVHQLLHQTAHHIVLAEASNRRKERLQRERQSGERHGDEERARPEKNCTPSEGTSHQVLRQRESAKRQSQEQKRQPRWRWPLILVSPVARLRWLYPTEVAVVLCLALLVAADNKVSGGYGGSVTVVVDEPHVVPEGDRRPEPEPVVKVQEHKGCSLKELGKTLILVNCPGSWARMRWDKRWVLDEGQNETEALSFFHRSDAAGEVAVTSSSAAQEEQTESKPAALPQPADPAPADRVSAQTPPQQAEPVASQPQWQAPIVPPSQAQSQQKPAAPVPAPSRPQAGPPVATLPAPARQQPVQDVQINPARQCTVSRPKPGFQVYLVTCPNSRAMIGRTVDSPTGWTVSEGVNATEALEFFLKSRYAR